MLHTLPDAPRRRAEVEDRNMILPEMDEPAQPRTQPDELKPREVADVDGVLQALAVVDHGLVNATEPTGFADVVRDEKADAFGHRRYRVVRGTYCSSWPSMTAASWRACSSIARR